MPPGSDARFGGNAPQSVAISPARSAGDHELRNPRPAVDDEWQRPLPAAHLPARREQAWIVLAWLGRPHREKKPRLTAVGQGPRRDRGRDALSNHRDLRL